MKANFFAKIVLPVCALAAVATNVSAHQLTRDEVRQELVQSINNGSRFVTDTSYPDVSPIFEQQVAQLRQANRAESNSKAGNPSPKQDENTPEPCVGPVSFCNVYFGS